MCTVFAQLALANATLVTLVTIVQPLVLMVGLETFVMFPSATTSAMEEVFVSFLASASAIKDSVEATASKCTATRIAQTMEFAQPHPAQTPWAM